MAEAGSEDVRVFEAFSPLWIGSPLWDDCGSCKWAGVACMIHPAPATEDSAPNRTYADGEGHWDA